MAAAGLVKIAHFQIRPPIAAERRRDARGATAADAGGLDATPKGDKVAPATRLWGTPMLRHRNVDIAECYQQAQHCAEYADGISDARASDQFRLLGQGWLKMAHGMEAADRFTAFIQRVKLKIH